MQFLKGATIIMHLFNCNHQVGKSVSLYRAEKRESKSN